MNPFDLVSASVAAVSLATAGSRRMSATEAADLDDEVRRFAQEEGADPERATQVARQLADATQVFAAASVTANHAAKQMAAALLEIEKLACEIIDKASREESE